MPRQPAYPHHVVADFVRYARRDPENRTIPSSRPALVAADGTTEDPLPTETPEDA